MEIKSELFKENKDLKFIKNSSKVFQKNDD